MVFRDVISYAVPWINCLDLAANYQKDITSRLWSLSWHLTYRPLYFSVIQVIAILYISCLTAEWVSNRDDLTNGRKLYCPRNTLHMHLFISFIMRAFMALLRDNLFVDGLDSFALSTDEALAEANVDDLLHQYPGTGGVSIFLFSFLRRLW